MGWLEEHAILILLIMGMPPTRLGGEIVQEINMQSNKADSSVHERSGVIKKTWGDSSPAGDSGSAEQTPKRRNRNREV